MPNQPQERVTVEEVRAEAEKWAKHHRAQQEAAEELIYRNDGGDYSVEREHEVAAEAFEEIVHFIDTGPHAEDRARLHVLTRRLKEEHGGRKH